jgi:cellulose synthase/poly-beta-1,6-N-acetylglucosamine synthase-like glycosyltransferase
VTPLAWVLIAAPVALGLYAYGLYPGLLYLWGRVRPFPLPATSPDVEDWPAISISLPAYNEAERIRGALEAILAANYPSDRRQILVVSDASNDGTDEIVAEYASRGVQLLRLPERGGKTAGENAAIPHLAGQIVVNTDASVRILPDALQALVAVFQDPAIGLASGRDVSWGEEGSEKNRGETGYVGYEMWVRALETRVGSIVGASGCFYAIRPELHRADVPSHLSRDFASALITREHGYRAVSVDDAVCVVPRTGSLGVEFRRKARTMARGLDTLWYKRRLLNPFRFGAFAWKLASHKLCRWLVPPSLGFATLGVGILALEQPLARWALGLLAAAFALSGLAIRVGGRSAWTRRFASLAYLAMSTGAAGLAWAQFLARRRNATWEPTRRAEVSPSGVAEPQPPPG